MLEAATMKYASEPCAARRLPIVIRTAADIERLLSSPRAAKRLPRGGLAIDIPGIDEHTRDRFRVRLNKYVHACGCAAGGATFLVTSIVFVAFTVRTALNNAWGDFVRVAFAGL